MVKKKRFLCGHVGHGRWCHRCDQAEELEKKLGKKKDEKILAVIANLKSVPNTKWKLAPKHKMAH